MKLHEIVRDGVEKFDNDFPCKEHYLHKQVKDLIIPFIISSQLSLLEAVKEMVEIMEVPPYPIENYRNERLVALQDGAKIGYQQALSDTSTTLSEEINLIKGV